MAAQLVATAFAAAAALALSAPAGAARPLTTAVMDFEAVEREAHWAFPAIRAAGATRIRLHLSWRRIAPERPADARDPSDPAYEWRSFDEQVALAFAHSLEPFVSIGDVPTWAVNRSLGRDSTTPNISDFAAFAGAAAARYSGRFHPCPDAAYCEALPRVRYWQAWNEPNIVLFLRPQWFRGRFVAPGNYRQMVNAFSSAVKSVATNNGTRNLVIAGGTAPFSHSGNGVLPFMRAMLCLNRNLRPIAGCPASRFDIWTHHPYTQGGPRREAFDPRNVSLGDLPEMKRVLRAAIRARKIAPNPNQRVQWWATEFSWDTNGPDPYMIGARTHAGWVAEALYRMWRSGISLVTWFQVRDQPIRSGRYQSGLHYVNRRRKLAFYAFRFPFVALAEKRRVRVWGRVPPPASAGERVVVERRRGSRWVRFRTLRTNRYGIFSARPRSSVTRGYFRAVLRRGTTRTRSLGFSSSPTRDIFLTLGPFGCGGPEIPC